MNRFLASLPLLFSLCALFILTGCGSGGTQLRVLQGSPFQSSVNVLNNGNTVSSSLAYGTVTSYFSAGSSSPHLQIELPSSTTPILDQTLSLSGPNSTFVLVTSLNSFTGFLVSDNNSAPSSGNANLRILNGSPDLTSADVYVVNPANGTSILGLNATVSGLAFQNTSSYQSLSQGTYEVFFAFAGTKTVVADSGSFTLSAGQVVTVAAIASVNNGSNAVLLSDVN